MNESICCHSCGEEEKYVALVRTSAEFIFKGKVYSFPFPAEWVCMECLQEEINNLKYF
ncbi:hypothetical protein ABHP49_005395 [Bacillus cereus]